MKNFEFRDFFDSRKETNMRFRVQCSTEAFLNLKIIFIYSRRLYVRRAKAKFNVCVWFSFGSWNFVECMNAKHTTDRNVNEHKLCWSLKGNYSNVSQYRFTMHVIMCINKIRNNLSKIKKKKTKLWSIGGHNHILQ